MHPSVNDLVAAARGRINEISPEQAEALRVGGAVLVDVREPFEYSSGHLPDAVNLPRGVLEFQIHAHPAMACVPAEALSQPERTLVLYCLTGGRSALAADSLRQLGFSQVHSLAGGFNAWRNAGLPTTTD